MAAVTAATGVADVAENINAEWIAQEVRYDVQKPYLYNKLAHLVNLRGRNTKVYSEPIADELTAATSLTASDEVAAQVTSRSDLTVTAAPYGTAVFIDYEVITRSMWDEFAVAINRVVGACRRKIDNDVLALATSFSNSIGSNATNHTVSNFQTVLTTWRAQVGDSMSRPIQVYHGDAMRDLAQDASTSAAGLMATVIGVNIYDASSQTAQGVSRSIGNIDVEETNNVSAGDTTGWSNFMTVNNPAQHGLVVAYEQDILVELQHVPIRRGWYIVGSVVHGAGIVNQDLCLTWITRT
jgi:hypothetical protein